MREEIRIRHKQFMGIDPSHPRTRKDMKMIQENYFK